MMWFRKSIIFSIFVLSLVSSFTAEMGPSGWLKYSDNPVLVLDSNDSDRAWSPSVLKEDSTYQMWYTGSDGTDQWISYATSNDGIDWTKHSSNPVISAEASRAFVMKDGSTYKIWYTSDTGYTEISYATSNDGVNWSSYGSNPVISGGGYAYEPTVIKDGSTYKMWYSGSGVIYYRTSSDGVNWSSASSVLSIGGSWVSSSVVKNGSIYRMWYTNSAQNQIKYATSSDGISWTASETQYILTGSGSAWDSDYVHGPSVIQDGSTYKIGYTGVEGTDYQIGYATAEETNIIDLNTQANVTFYGADSGDTLGSVAGTGDVNGDGYQDIIIGAAKADGSGNGKSDSGEAYVFYNASTLSGDIDLSTATPDIILYGPDAGDWAGYFTIMEDVNGDGIDDMIIDSLWGCPSGSGYSSCGEYYIVYGSTSLPSTIDLGTQANVTLYYGGSHGLSAGMTTGDFNNDSIYDIVFDVYAADPLGRSNAGAWYVVFGSANLSSSINLVTDANFTIYANDGDSATGIPPNRMGDVNGDGIDDIVIGDDQQKAVYVFYGATNLSGTKDLANNDQDVKIYDTTDNVNAIAGVGDVNGDGINDIFFSEMYADGPSDAREDAGDVYIIYGSSSLSSSIDVSTGAADVTIYGADAGDTLAIGSIGGDVNGDGINDIVVGARNADGPNNNRPVAGDMYVIYGSASLPSTIDLSNYTADAIIYGAEAGDGIVSYMTVKDVNDDNIDEIIFDSYQADGPSNARSDAGEMYIVYISTTPVVDTSAPRVTLNSPSNGERVAISNVTFAYTPSDISNITNCSLYGNFTGAWALNQTDTTIVKSTQNTFNIQNLTDGWYMWNVECADNNSYSGYANSNYTVHVDTSGTITVCSSGCDYTTIQAAINAASSENTIYLEAGTHYITDNESIRLNKTNVTLMGENRETTWINTTSYYGGIYIDANFTTIRDISLNNSPIIVWYWDYEGVTISNVQIFSSSDPAHNSAISLNGTLNNSMIENSRIMYSPGYSIYSHYKNSYNLSIVNNNITNGSRGIRLDIISSEIRNNSLQYNGNGTFILGDSNTISGNTIQYNGNGTFILGDSNTISGNTIQNNTGQITLSGNSNTITNNTIRYNDPVPMTFSGDSNTSVVDNLICSNNLAVYSGVTHGNNTCPIEPPSVALSSPSNNGNDLDGSVAFTYTPTDEVVYNQETISNCSLYTNITGNWSMNQTDTTISNAVQNSFSLSLLPGVYLWNVNCTDRDGNSAFASSNRTFRVTQVVINEFLPNPLGSGQEWIEIYNMRDSELNLSGWKLDDGSGGSDPYTIPDGTTVVAKRFIVFYSGTTDISLGDISDQVRLLDPEDNLIDSYSWSITVEDNSFGREPDGGSEWSTFVTPTPGTSNIGELQSNITNILINEFLANPGRSGVEWIEIYNNGTEAQNLSGWQVDDARSAGSSPYTIPGGTSLSAGGLLVFYGNDTGIVLGDMGDTVRILDSSGELVDEYTYYYSQHGVSIGRTTDGGSEWTTFNAPTPNITNSGANDTSAPVVSLNAPSNGSIDSDGYVYLTYTPIDASVMSYCMLYTNNTGYWTASQVDTTVWLSSQNGFFLSALSNGTYIWNVECRDENGYSDFAPSNWSFVVGRYANSTIYDTEVTATMNETTSVNSSDGNVSVELLTVENVSDARMTITTYPNSTKNATLSVPGLSKYISVDASPELLEGMSYAIISVYYTDAELTAANLTENNISMYWYNSSLNTWQQLNANTMDWVYGTGIDTTNKYLWANVTHFSDYTIAQLSESTESIVLTLGWNLISIPLAV